MNRQPTYNIPALEKGLDVLELLADSEAMTLTELADRLGRTKQELFRVVSCLFERGYLIRDPAQRYRMSTRLFELGSKHASVHSLTARAMPHMERIARELRESCHLNIVVGDRMLVVARADAEADVALTVRVGATFDLHRRNTGRTALAYFSEDARQGYWQRSGESSESIESLERNMATIRDHGYVVADSDVSVGVKDCVAPVLGAGGRLLGVLCVSHIVRIHEPAENQKLLEAVVDCAEAISREFGPPPIDVSIALIEDES